MLTKMPPTLIDSMAGSDVEITFEHHKIHEGDSFTSNTVIASGMADAATRVLAFKTPNTTKRSHMIFDFITLTGGHVDILEGPTWDNESGSLNTIKNRKRLTSMTSSTLLEDSGQAAFTATDNLVLDPTTLAGGTTIYTLYAFGVKNFFAGTARAQTEVILKPNTQYAYRFTSDAAANAVQMTLNFYEHTDS